ncbi:hemolysin D [Rhizobium sp. Root1203]|uniref:efflux RND transporter periplasmic adaptor subunit n=1 Tax=Rhizobium sp. Root1203 TaxID=1736427 RepID=UPI00070A5D60|nr:efflux RND transporter periplasmic adaptor subunit [Rhizobium sp. Root1203]KQV15771.1 hemolysin D [Rhizobium sp. Root1203]
MKVTFRKYLILLSYMAILGGTPALVSAQEGTGRPPPSVTIETVVEEPVEPPTEHIGRVEALEAVDLRARVPGFIEEIAFTPGSSVKAGDLLFIVEPARYEAAVAAARAQVARAGAVLRQATISRDRNAELVRRNTAARAVLDDAQAAYDIANADVAAAEASLSKAELDLSYTRITAPISGRIGQPLLTRGNLVASDATVLARLVQTDPVRVAFSVAEADIITVRQAQLAGSGSGRDVFRLSLKLPNGTTYGQEGTIEFLSPEVDPQTGTVAVRTIFPNPDGILMPGQFVNLAFASTNEKMGPVIAQWAVLQDRDGRFVYVLNEDNTVHQRRIETGAKIGERWAVALGIKPGERVVVQGTQRLSDGIAVQPVSSSGGSL